MVTRGISDAQACPCDPTAGFIKLPMLFRKIVAEIVRFAIFSWVDVEHRAWRQTLEPGWKAVPNIAHYLPGRLPVIRGRR
jgi:hypothetical protein